MPRSTDTNQDDIDAINVLLRGMQARLKRSEDAIAIIHGYLENGYERERILRDALTRIKQEVITFNKVGFGWRGQDPGGVVVAFSVEEWARFQDMVASLAELEQRSLDGNAKADDLRVLLKEARNTLMLYRSDTRIIERIDEALA